jgi:predicted DNA-binding ribbon-helix-helix protein
MTGGAKLRKRSVTIAGHRTSVSLEDAFWDKLHEMAREQQTTLIALITAVDAGRTGNLSGALRVAVLDWLAERAANRA